MKIFFIRITYLLSPLILLFILFLFFDPFNIVHSGFQEFKSRNQLATDVVKMESYVNNDIKTTKTLVLSNSKGNAFREKSVSKFINNGKSINLSTPGENLEFIKNKILYSIKNNDSLEHILIILDDFILNDKKGDILRGPVYIHHPISTGKFWPNTILEGFSNFIDNYYFVKYFGVVTSLSNDSNSFISLNDLNRTVSSEDLYYNRDRKNIDFGDSLDLSFNVKLNENDVKILKVIFDRCIARKIRIKIVFGPYYWSNKINEDVIDIFRNVFGQSNVFDYSGNSKFSGKHIFWEDKKHYSLNVGDEILKDIFHD